jgi:hypothetical protein
MAQAFSENDARKFWKRVNKTDECWLWTGKPHRSDAWGYGRLTVNGKTIKAHRFAYILAYGDIPSGMLVRHRCDNPLCVRPDHLLLGTDQDNIDDKVSRGRQAKGERVGSAILSDANVVEIRAIYERGESHQAGIARLFGVDRRTINRIVHYQSR